MLTKQSNREYYYGLDGVRFCAALMVVIFHLGRSVNNVGSRGYAISEGKLGTGLSDYVQWGSVGVEIFFIVSGLVIANSANGSSPYKFLRSRAERLYPATWLCATITCLAWALNPNTPIAETISRYVKSMTLFPFGEWIDAPYWTLGHEIIFYGVVWLLLVIGRVRNLEVLAIGIAAISGFYWACMALVKLGGISLPIVEILGDGVPKMLFPVYGGYFALGMFIWLFRHSTVTLLGRVFACVALFACLAPSLISLITNHTVSPGFCAIAVGMVVITISANMPSTRNDENLIRRCVRVAGLATFPLYLLHYAVGATIMRFFVDQGMQAVFAFMIAVVLLVITAVFIATVPEPAIRRLLDKFFGALENNPGWIGKTVRSLSTNNAPIAARNAAA